MKQKTLAAGALALVAVLALAAPAAAEPSSTAATLSILVPDVYHVPAGAADARPAAPGMDLHEGDRVITGPRGVALITFLNGSTVTVEPGSDVAVREAMNGAEPSRIGIVIRAGRVWARVVRLLGRSSAMSLESNEYAATAHDGLIGAERSAGGRFVCWTRAGTLELADRAGRVLAAVQPGHKATVEPGAAPVVETFRAHASALAITASSNVLPLIEMPDGGRRAGFAGPGTDVNYVFGSLTVERPEARVVEVPAGVRGPYRLLLTGLADGPFSLAIVGMHRGEPVYRYFVTGTIQRGQVLATRIEQVLAPGGSGDPRTARVIAGSVDPLIARAPAAASWPAASPVITR